MQGVLERQQGVKSPPLAPAPRVPFTTPRWIKVRTFLSPHFQRLLFIGPFLLLINFAFQPFTNFYPVVPGTLYRSAQPSGTDLVRWKNEAGLRTVVNLRGEWPEDDWYVSETTMCKKLDIVQRNIRMLSYRIAPLDELRELVKIYDKCPKPILVHCRQGADRTALATVIYLLLNEQISLEEALKQFSLLKWHTGFAFGDHLPNLFDCYRDWLTLKRLRHSPETFRNWLATETAISYFGSEITLQDSPTELVAATPATLHFRAKNTSRYSWKMASKKTPGIHLRVWIYERENSAPVKATLLSQGETIPPGESIDFAVAVPAQTNTVKVLVVVDLAEQTGIRFSQLGDACWTRYLPVVTRSTVGSPANP